MKTIVYLILFCLLIASLTLSSCNIDQIPIYNLKKVKRNAFIGKGCVDNMLIAMLPYILDSTDTNSYFIPYQQRKRVSDSIVKNKLQKIRVLKAKKNDLVWLANIVDEGTNETIFTMPDSGGCTPSFNRRYWYIRKKNYTKIVITLPHKFDKFALTDTITGPFFFEAHYE